MLSPTSVLSRRAKRHIPINNNCYVAGKMKNVPNILAARKSTEGQINVRNS